nr:MAG TPA: hypothetical protein [Caudoviricetes sp.]
MYSIIHKSYTNFYKKIQDNIKSFPYYIQQIRDIITHNKT